MKIAVLGAVCFDEIAPLEGPRRESFGGILYNTVAFSSVLEDGDWVRPVTNLGEDRYAAAMEHFSKLPHVDVSALARAPGRLTHVLLTWKTASWRDEVCRYMMKAFDASVAKKVSDCDAVHINFINGTELNLDVLRAIRQSFSGLISLDVHNLISVFSEEGKRTIVGFKQWREWVPHLDIVQCNEFEIAQMFDRKVESRAEMAIAAKEVAMAGPRVVSVTLGPEGAITVHRRNGDYYMLDIGVLPPVKAVDPTGCGDSFSAGFIVAMLRYDDPATAVACGTLVAGVNARYAGIGHLAEAKGYLEAPRSHFALYAGKPPDWPGEPI